MKALMPEAYESENVPIHPGRCAGEVAKFLEEHARDWTLVCDGGEAAVWMIIAARRESSGADPFLGTERYHRDRTRPGCRGLGRQPETGPVVHRGRELRILCHGNGHHGQTGYSCGLCHFQ